MSMETRCFHKRLEFQRYPTKEFCTARYEHKSSKKKFPTFQKLRKNNSWADLGPRSAWEKLSQMFVRRGEIPSPGQTSIGKTNDCPMNLNGARSLGAPTSDGYQVSSSVIYHVIYRWYININITVLFLISWYGIMWYVIYHVIYHMIYHISSDIFDISYDMTWLWPSLE